MTATITLQRERCECRPDQRDLDIAQDRFARYDTRPGLRVGDWIEFPDGQARRVAYIWADENAVPFGVQTGHGDCFYHLSDGWVNMGNGSLYVSVPPDTITAANRTRDGDMWVEHHGYLGPSSRIWLTAPFRVFTCTADAPRA